MPWSSASVCHSSVCHSFVCHSFVCYSSVCYSSVCYSSVFRFRLCTFASDCFALVDLSIVVDLSATYASFPLTSRRTCHVFICYFRTWFACSMVIAMYVSFPVFSSPAVLLTYYRMLSYMHHALRYFRIYLVCLSFFTSAWSYPSAMCICFSLTSYRMCMATSGSLRSCCMSFWFPLRILTPLLLCALFFHSLVTDCVRHHRNNHRVSRLLPRCMSYFRLRILFRYVIFCAHLLQTVHGVTVLPRSSRVYFPRFSCVFFGAVCLLFSTLWTCSLPRFASTCAYLLQTGHGITVSSAI